MNSNNTNFLNIEQLQRVIDHFGIGKIQNLNNIKSQFINNYSINLYYVKTNKGDFLISEYPNSITNRTEFHQQLRKLLSFGDSISVYPASENTKFAHINGLYYCVDFS